MNAHQKKLKPSLPSLNSRCEVVNVEEKLLNKSICFLKSFPFTSFHFTSSI